MLHVTEGELLLADEQAASPRIEQHRIAALLDLQVLDSAPEPLFDAIVATAAQACGMPVALLSLVDAERQWFKAKVGLPGVAQTARDIAFCDHTIRSERLLEVGNAAADPRFAANPLVRGDPNIRFYAGAPVVMPGGARIGTVCVIGHEPAQLNAAQRDTLQSLSRVASAALLERRRGIEATQALAASEASHRAIVEGQAELISLAAVDGTLSFANAAYARHYGVAARDLVGRNLFDFVDAADQPGLRLHLDSMCRQRSAVNGVNRTTSADGQPRWVMWNNRPVVDPVNGEVIQIQSVGRDITEQRLAEQALADSERRYRRLYESTPAFLHSVDAQGRLLTASDRWLALAGYARDAVIGRPSTDFLVPDPAAGADDGNDNDADATAPCRFHDRDSDRVACQLIRADGSRLDVLLSARLERDGDGTLLRTLAVIEDVSETRRIAAELGRTHARLDAIVDNMPALIGHWDAAAVTRFANREFQAAFGQPMASIIGLPLQAVCHTADAELWSELGPRVAAVLSGRRQDFELAMLTTSGLRQLRVNLVPDQPRDGHVTGFYGLAHDITGRKTLELRLGESEQRYRSLFDNLNSGFALHEIVVDASGQPVDYKFLAMNEAFSAMTGLLPAAAIGRRATELMPGIEHEPGDWINIFGGVALSGVPRHFEQHSAALDRWFEVVAYRPAAGQFAVVAQDITQRKASAVQLHDALHEKETLLKEVYHRVKNNLQVVQSLLQLQHRSVADGAARVALEDSVQRVQAMALVHEKLYQSGSLASVSLADYAHDLLQQIDKASSAGRRGVRLSADVAALQTSLDSAIPFGLLVTELVSNALKHAFADRAGGEIRVALQAVDGGGARLSVSDDGCGLPAGFDLSAVPSMGLQLAANLTRQLGGTLSADSGAGSCFSALLTRL